MGINGLLPFVSEYAHKISLEDLSGKVCGIDVLGWLYKGTYSWAYELKAIQIKPVLVFDGIMPDLKATCYIQEKRTQIKEP